MRQLISRIVPQQIDNQYRGQKLALWLFGFVVFVKALQMVVSIVNGYSTLRNADGIPLDTYPVAAAQTIVALAALLAFTYLVVCFIATVVLVRYRRAVPFMFALLLLDYVSRRVILHFLPVVRVGTPPGFIVNSVLVAIMVVGLALSVWPSRKT
jgi:hypothetical protein